LEGCVVDDHRITEPLEKNKGDVAAYDLSGIDTTGK